jgi:hypothetical protein
LRARSVALLRGQELGNENNVYAKMPGKIVKIMAKVGDKVESGERLGDSNYTRGGVLATGLNARVAYMPYYGLNSNDAVVISEGFAERMNELRRRVPDLLYFGGVAFKGQAFVRDEDLAPLASEAQRHMDVVTTSGPRTGAAADPARVAALADPVEPPTAVGLASSVTSKNVHLYPAAAAFLVATGIEQSNGVLDPAKVRATADTIERGAALRTTS